MCFWNNFRPFPIGIDTSITAKNNQMSPMNVQSTLMVIQQLPTNYVQQSLNTHTRYPSVTELAIWLHTSISLRGVMHIKLIYCFNTRKRAMTDLNKRKRAVGNSLSSLNPRLLGVKELESSHSHFNSPFNS